MPVPYQWTLHCGQTDGCRCVQNTCHVCKQARSTRIDLDGKTAVVDWGNFSPPSQAITRNKYWNPMLALWDLKEEGNPKLVWSKPLAMARAASGPKSNDFATQMRRKEADDLLVMQIRGYICIEYDAVAMIPLDDPGVPPEVRVACHVLQAVDEMRPVLKTLVDARQKRNEAIAVAQQKRDEVKAVKKAALDAREKTKAAFVTGVKRARPDASDEELHTLFKYATT